MYQEVESRSMYILHAVALYFSSNKCVLRHILIKLIIFISHCCHCSKILCVSPDDWKEEKERVTLTYTTLTLSDDGSQDRTSLFNFRVTKIMTPYAACPCFNLFYSALISQNQWKTNDILSSLSALPTNTNGFFHW